MYLNKQKRKNGDVYLSIREKYHVPGKGSRERTIESLGYLSDLKKEYDDPIKHFTEYTKELTEKKKEEATKEITIKVNETLDIGTNDLKNIGYGIIKDIYKKLELDKFWLWKTRDRKIEFSADRIFRLLVFARTLTPGSKRYTLNNSDYYFEPHEDITLDDVYHALDIFAENQNELQLWLYKKSQKLCKRDMSTSYFDCTNYYFDISKPALDTLDDNGDPVNDKGEPCPAKYQKRGPEKNHRPDPIVEMGLIMDKNGIPVAYDLFPGNESEKVHMRPIVNRIKDEFSNTRMIFVADRGLNTSDNIYWLNGDNRADENKRDGYVYGQSIRGASDEFKKWAIDKEGYVNDIIEDDGVKISFIHKSRIEVKELNVNLMHASSKKPKKKKVMVDQRQMVYYSEKYARKQRIERYHMVERAKDLIKHPDKYTKVTAKGSSKYIKNISFDKTTGEVKGTELLLDDELIKDEEKYDGYYSIVTSELKLSDYEIRKIYRGLAKIEDTFKVTKTCLKSRPIYVRTNDHIDAHFTTCFTALLIMRLLEHLLGNKYSPQRIIDSLNKYSCSKLEGNMWQIVFYDEVIDDCGKILDLKLNKKYRTRQEIQRYLRY